MPNIEDADAPEDALRFEIIQHGETTYAQIVALAKAALDLGELVNGIAGHLAAREGGGDFAPIDFRVPFLLVYDGEHGDRKAPWASACEDKCALAIPTFFGSPAAIVFICRTCGARVCWRHAVTDSTGGWCIEHRPHPENS